MPGFPSRVDGIVLLQNTPYDFAQTTVENSTHPNALANHQLPVRNPAARDFKVLMYGELIRANPPINVVCPKLEAIYRCFF